MKKILLFFAALAASQFSQAASSDCVVLNKTADRNGAVYSPVLGKKVMKKGRRYFHTAPHSSGKMPSTFLLSKEIM
ncbi:MULTISPECIES: hypothetical protein [Neisseria]|uniref:hypothetical protein n=1 Tax=Neisseria TaxID=482 RepID=UPI0016605617|nr:MULTISPECIES: hypothetical protein [Neisseria]